MPDVPDPQSYIIFDTAHTIDISPMFVAVPACGFEMSFTYEWTIPDGAPITITPDNPYQLTVESDNAADHATYTLIMKNVAIW